MKCNKLVFLILVTLSRLSLADDWFRDSAKLLCRGVTYNHSCNHCEDGFAIGSFTDKSTDTLFAMYTQNECGEPEDKCGYVFILESNVKKRVKCEEFVKIIQKKQKDCKGCLLVKEAGS